MVDICFYFQVHQPYRLRPYQFFDIGNNHHYFSDEMNGGIFDKVSRKCYLPTNKMLLHLLQQHPELRLSFSFSGVFLEQCEQYNPEVLQSFKALIDTGQVEVLAETYYHSLAFIFSEQEFIDQIALHTNKIKELFGCTPHVLRNTELIYRNDLAPIAHRLGFKGVLAEGADHILSWRSPNFMYQTKGVPVKMLLKHYRLSDDIAFRFSNQEWSQWPLEAPTFAQWINQIHGNGTNVNLFMDYETFGEHQWESTGIFDFVSHAVKELIKNPDNRFSLPSQLVDTYEPVDEIDVPDFMSWADEERDISAWLGNRMQRSATQRLYELKDAVLANGDPSIVADWRKLQTSDHFYYMCTKWFADGDVHKYFNPYQSPYDAFIYFMNALTDLRSRL